MYLLHNYTESMEPNREFLKVPRNWCRNALIKRKKHVSSNFPFTHLGVKTYKNSAFCALKKFRI